MKKGQETRKMRFVAIADGKILRASTKKSRFQPINDVSH